MWLSYSCVFPWRNTGSGVKSLKYLHGRNGEGVGVFISYALIDISSTLGFDFADSAQTEYCSTFHCLCVCVYRAQA